MSRPKPETRPHMQSADPSLTHVPPQALDAEMSLLSAILIDNSVLYDVLAILKPADFYRTAHQKIYEAVEGLFSENDPVDLVTLANALKKRGTLEAVGGAVYLTRLVDSVPMSSNALAHARIIRDAACLRRLIERSNAIIRRCFEGLGNVDATLDFAENAIFEIAENKIKPAFSDIKTLVGQAMLAVEQRHENRTLVTGVPTGYTHLDSLTAGLQNSDLILLAGRPSMGKTAFSLCIARNAAMKHDVPVAIFSLEMSKEQLTQRLLCSVARVDSTRLRSGFLDRDSWIQLNEASNSLSNASLYIDDSPGMSVAEIRAKTRRLKMEKGIGLIVIDYLQLMRGRNSERRDLEISDISMGLKSLAKELNIPVMALSQLNRKLEDRSDRRPQLADLRDSGSLEQDADVVMFVYRDEMYNKDENNPNRGKAEIIIAKQRNGPTGTVNLAYLNAYTSMENLTP